MRTARAVVWGLALAGMLAWSGGLALSVGADQDEPAGDVSYGSVEQATQALAQQAIEGGYILSIDGQLYGPADLVREQRDREALTYDDKSKLAHAFSFRGRRVTRQEFVKRLKQVYAQMKDEERDHYYKFGGPGAEN